VKKGFLVTLVLVIVFSGFLTACGSAQQKQSEGPYKVAFVYIGPPGDLGWSYEHDRGRKMLEAEFGENIETAYIESVEEGPDSLRSSRTF
jgi:basic membrane protein A